MTGQCTLVCCTFERARADRAPGRRDLRPLYSPAVATRDAAAGASTCEQELCENWTGDGNVCACDLLDLTCTAETRKEQA